MNALETIRDLVAKMDDEQPIGHVGSCCYGARPALKLLVETVEAAREFTSGSRCAWCGNLAVAFISRHDGGQEGHCCPDCMGVMRDTYEIVQTSLPDPSALDALLAKLEEQDAND